MEVVIFIEQVHFALSPGIFFMRFTYYRIIYTCAKGSLEKGWGASPPPPLEQNYYLLKAWHCNRKSTRGKLLFIQHAAFFIMIATLMISLTQSEANLLYPSNNLDSSGVVFSEKQNEKVSGSIQARK